MNVASGLRVRYTVPYSMCSCYEYATSISRAAPPRAGMPSASDIPETKRQGSDLGFFRRKSTKTSKIPGFSRSGHFGTVFLFPLFPNLHMRFPIFPLLFTAYGPLFPSGRDFGRRDRESWRVQIERGLTRSYGIDDPGQDDRLTRSSSGHRSSRPDYREAFSGEVAKAREDAPSVAGDLLLVATTRRPRARWPESQRPTGTGRFASSIKTCF